MVELCRQRGVEPCWALGSFAAWPTPLKFPIYSRIPHQSRRNSLPDGGFRRRCPWSRPLSNSHPHPSSVNRCPAPHSDVCTMHPRTRRPAANAACVLTAVLVMGLTTTTSTLGAELPDRPPNYQHVSSWTTSRQQMGPHKSEALSDNWQLEEQASLELRETFGENFCRQLEEEDEVVRSVHDQKARIGREAGCHPTSPLASQWPERSSSSSSASLGRAGGGEGRTQDGIGGPMADWLR